MGNGKGNRVAEHGKTLKSFRTGYEKIRFSVPKGSIRHKDRRKKLQEEWDNE